MLLQFVTFFVPLSLTKFSTPSYNSPLPYTSILKPLPDTISPCTSPQPVTRMGVMRYTGHRGRIHGCTKARLLLITVASLYSLGSLFSFFFLLPSKENSDYVTPPRIRLGNYFRSPMTSPCHSNIMRNGMSERDYMYDFYTPTLEIVQRQVNKIPLEVSIDEVVELVKAVSPSLQISVDAIRSKLLPPDFSHHSSEHPIAQGFYRSVYQHPGFSDLVIRLPRHQNSTHLHRRYIIELLSILAISPSELVGWSADGAVVSPLREGGITEAEERLPALISAAEVVVAVHGLGAVHTDLNVGQFLLKSPSSVVLTDFNRVRFLDSSEVGLCPIKIRGRSGMYRSPEEYNYFWLTQAVDIYSFAYVIFEVWFREPPYMSRGYFAIKAKRVVMNGGIAIQAPRMQSQEDFAIWDLVKEMLAAEPNERPTMIQVRERLKETKLMAEPS